jgi:hypothetical protein
MTEPLDSLRETHRRAFNEIFRELGDFLRRREVSYNSQLNRAIKAKQKERSEIIASQLEAFKSIRKLVQQLYKDKDMLSLALQIQGQFQRTERNMQDPTEDEIVLACKRIQEGWTESEKQNRLCVKQKSVEVKEANFLF